MLDITPAPRLSIKFYHSFALAYPFLFCLMIPFFLLLLIHTGKVCTQRQHTKQTTTQEKQKICCRV